MKTNVKLVSNKPDEYITMDSVVDGPGLRCTIWFQGCPHHCPGCHNPTTHEISCGYDVNLIQVKENIRKISENKLYKGITFSGGDPLFQLEEFLELAACANTYGLDVWCYTGFTYEYLLKNNIFSQLRDIDVLVDGPFVLLKKSFNIDYRGSTNQRLIDVKKSIKEDKLCLYKMEKEQKIEKDDNLFI